MQGTSPPKAASRRPRTGAFWSSARPSRGVAPPGPPRYLGPRPPRLSPPSLPAAVPPRPGKCRGGPLGLRQSPSCACARVTPGPEGSLYRDALPAGLCTYCKKQLFESCCFWVLFSSPCPVPSSLPRYPHPLYLVGEMLAGPGSDHGSVAAPAYCPRRLLVRLIFFFLSSLH